MGVYNYDAINDELVPIAGTSAEQGLSDKVSKYSADSTYWDTTPTSSSTKPVTSGGILTDINSKVSHENLLDNPWFTVNQRGLSNYGYGAVWTVDRWRNIVGNRGGITNVDSNGITFTCIASGTGNPFLREQTEVNVKKHIGIGQKITVSIKMKNGDIATATGVIENVSYTENFIVKVEYDIMNNNTLMGVLSASVFENNDGLMFVNLRIDRASGINVDFGVDIRAIKVEVGEVSTLHLDAAPNYQQELAKCQRYFIRYKNRDGVSKDAIAIGKVVNNSGDVVYNIPLPVEMRAWPTVSFSTDALGYTNDSTLNIDNFDTNGGFYCSNLSRSIISRKSNAGLVAGDVVLIMLNPSSYIDFSADL